MTKKGFIFILFVFLILINGPLYAKTFKGRVIDADTKEPIEGAVVVATWLKERATIAGPSSELKDVREALTGKNGEWVIKGPKGRWGGDITAIFTFLTGIYYTKPPEFIIFKPGYCSWPEGFGIDACKGKIKRRGDEKTAEGETVELPRLTNREDRLRALPGPVRAEGVSEKQKEFIRLINEERRNLGLEQYKIF